jgi:hypothetical protein
MRTERRRVGESREAQEPLAQRLWRDMAAQLAERLGCCPMHGTTLICCVCNVAWTTSANEQMEVEALLQRTTLYHLTWPTWPCARCGNQDVALCLDCYQPVAEQAFAGLSPAEEARGRELLCKNMRFTRMPGPDAADAQMGAHEGGETP